MSRADFRTKPYKVFKTPEVRVSLNPSSLHLLRACQQQRQESSGQKVTVSKIINECVYSHLNHQI